MRALYSSALCIEKPFEQRIAIRSEIGHVVMGKTEHVGIKAARQPQERYWNALQLRPDTGIFRLGRAALKIPT